MRVDDVELPAVELNLDQSALRFSIAGPAERLGRRPERITREGCRLRTAMPNCSPKTRIVGWKCRSMPSLTATAAAWSMPPLRTRPTLTSCSATTSGPQAAMTSAIRPGPISVRPDQRWTL